MNIYKINNTKFKGVYLSLNFLMQADRKVLSTNSILASMLSKDTKKYGMQKDIEKYLSNLYGAVFNVNVEKYGDIQNVEFRIECINSNCTNIDEDVINKCIDFLHDIVYNTKINKIDFNEDVFEREKSFILEKISARRDEKLKYAVNRTEEIMSPNTGFGTFLYGDEEIVRCLKPADIIDEYDNLINNSFPVFILSGNLSGLEKIEDYINDTFKNGNNNGIKLSDIKYNIKTDDVILKETREKCESVQSVMTAGFIISDVKEDDMYKINVYNAILGSTPSSKLFQIFREKESLAYTARSRYYRFKDMIIIYAGINGENYEKGKEVINRIIGDIADNKFTEEELDAAKKSLVADLKEWEDSKSMMAKALMSDLISYGKQTRTIEDMEKQILKVTRKDVIEIAKKIQFKMWYLLGGGASE